MHHESQVRNQRNKFVTLIASAGQAAAEMGDRLRLLGSESDVLAQDAADKTAALSRVSPTYSVLHANVLLPRC